MRFVAPPYTEHRLQRFHRWAMLWLKWFAAFLDAAACFAPLSAQAQTIGHHWLNRIERVVVAVAMLRAVPHVRAMMPHGGVAQHRCKQAALSRAVVGSALRRSLRSKNLRERIERLTQDIDVLVPRLLRRLPRGLTRRRPIKARREHNQAVALSAPSSLARAEDTS